MQKITKKDYEELKNKIQILSEFLNGGKGSGNWGHTGRPGKVGGSGKGGSIASKKSTDKEEGKKSDIEAIGGNKWTKKFVEEKKFKDRLDDSDLKGLAEIAKTGKISYENVTKMKSIREAMDYVNSHKPLDPEQNKALVDKTEKEFLSQITKEAEARGGVKNEKKVFLITGLPGAGKTSNGLGDKLNSGYVEFDNDIAKGVPALSKHFDGGKGANTVQDVSSKAQEQALQKLMSQGTNIAWPMVGKNPDKLEAQIRKFNKAGYKVELALVHADLGTSLARTTTRFLETGRFVGPDYVKSCTKRGKNPLDVYKKFEKSGFTDEDGKKINVKFSGIKNA